MALIVKDNNGNFVTVAESVAVGVEVTQVARQLEVGGLILSRTNSGGIGVAAGLASEGDTPDTPDGSLFTNPSYDPSKPFTGFVRTINMKNGNVGIGKSNEVKIPTERLVVEGNMHVSETAILGGAFGGAGTAGQLVLRDETGERIIALQAGTGDLKIGGHGKDGDITLFPREATDISTPAQAKIHLDGQSGDIRLLNGDAAEEFDVLSDRLPEPGDVMVLGNDGQLRLCDDAYDRRVAGVVSGAGRHRPGIVLGHDQSRPGRVQVALIGRVYCKANADDGPIAVGDLLTTSSLPGHAMRVTKQDRAFGAVLGKAMGRLEHGTGLVEVLVALQ